MYLFALVIKFTICGKEKMRDPFLFGIEKYCIFSPSPKNLKRDKKYFILKGSRVILFSYPMFRA